MHHRHTIVKNRIFEIYAIPCIWKIFEKKYILWVYEHSIVYSGTFFSYAIPRLM
jgi:hypothetical protein